MKEINVVYYTLYIYLLCLNKSSLEMKFCFTEFTASVNERYSHIIICTTKSFHLLYHNIYNIIKQILTILLAIIIKTKLLILIVLNIIFKTITFEEINVDKNRTSFTNVLFEPPFFFLQ